MIDHTELAGRIEKLAAVTLDPAVGQEVPGVPRAHAWVSWLRDMKRRGLLADETVERLDELGFDWQDREPEVVAIQPPEPEPVPISNPGTLRRFEGTGGGRFVGTRFMEINKRWSTMRSANLHAQLRDDPGQWQEYHDEYERQRNRWPCVPAIEIADEIARLWPRRARYIADLGCGREELIRHRLKSTSHTVTGFDHVGWNEIVSADISDLGTERDETFDIAVLSLALVGSNRGDYCEATLRLIPTDGSLFVAETQQRHEEIVLPRLQELPVSIESEVELPGGFIMLRARKEG